ncbi:hypothetical protein P692DRAFT_201787046 [Suillus brevipes Sb2]|nr:hypothetical protein P692DRAFT_201787046 [Suillus brevipes Sb2]
MIAMKYRSGSPGLLLKRLDGLGAVHTLLKVCDHHYWKSQELGVPVIFFDITHALLGLHV